MFGRIARMLLAAAVADFSGVLIQAGRDWLGRKLQPKVKDEQGESSPQGSQSEGKQDNG